MLFAAGRLDRTMGQAHPFPDVESWGFTQHAPFYAVYETNQRSVYLMQQRLKRHPLLALFDGADPNATTPVRTSTTVPTQALFLMNSEFVHSCAAGLVERLMNSSSEPDGTHSTGVSDWLLDARPRVVEVQQADEFLATSQDAALEKAVSVRECRVARLVGFDASAVDV